MALDNIDLYKVFIREKLEHGKEWLEATKSFDKDVHNDFLKKHIDFLNKYFYSNKFDYSKQISLEYGDRHTFNLFYEQKNHHKIEVKNPIIQYGSWLSAIINLNDSLRDHSSDLIKNFRKEYVFNQSLKNKVGPKVIDFYIASLDVLADMGYLKETYNGDIFKEKLYNLLEKNKRDIIKDAMYYREFKDSIGHLFLRIRGKDVKLFDPDMPLRYAYVAESLGYNFEMALKRDDLIYNLKSQSTPNIREKRIEVGF